LQPLALASDVRADVVVRLIVGDKDDTAPPVYSLRYAQALKTRGIDAQVTVVPTMGHNILLTMPVLTAVTNLLHAE
jgi:predicted esterase